MRTDMGRKANLRILKGKKSSTRFVVLVMLAMDVVS